MSATSSNILKGMFFCTVGLNSRLKIFRKPRCKQLCCHPGFVVPFIEHRQSRFNMILKVLIFSEWDMNIGFNFKSPDALTPKKGISISFEV